MLTTNLLVELVSRIVYGLFKKEEFFVRLLNEKSLTFLGPINPDALLSVQNHFEALGELLLKWKNNRPADSASSILCSDLASGVNLAHNFPFGFNTSVSPSSFLEFQCDPFYPGDFSLSEPESLAVSRYFEKGLSKWNTHLCLLLSPKGGALTLPIESRDQISLFSGSLFFPSDFKLKTLGDIDSNRNKGTLPQYLFQKFQIPSASFEFKQNSKKEAYHPRHASIREIGDGNVHGILEVVSRFKKLLVFIEQGLCSDVSNEYGPCSWIGSSHQRNSQWKSEPIYYVYFKVDMGFQSIKMIPEKKLRLCFGFSQIGSSISFELLKSLKGEADSFKATELENSCTKEALNLKFHNEFLLIFNKSDSSKQHSHYDQKLSLTIESSILSSGLKDSLVVFLKESFFQTTDDAQRNLESFFFLLGAIILGSGVLVSVILKLLEQTLGRFNTEN